MSNDETITTPGVFIEETSSAPVAIAGVATSTVAFVGTPSLLATDPADASTMRLVTSPGDYERSYGRLDDGSLLAAAVRGFFENGGDRAYVIPVPGGALAEPATIRDLVIPDDVATVATPDLLNAVDGSGGGFDAAAWTAVQAAMLARCERERRMYILDPPPNLDPQAVVDWRNGAGFDSAFGVLYHPWLTVLNPADRSTTIDVPPSGFVAGVWARVDSQRGVSKAPANEIVRGIVGLASDVDDRDQEILNPIGINVIRSFAGRGRRIWGARTLTTDVSWRYVNVRRLFTMLERSIESGTGWVVFDPNGPATWSRVSTSISNFLTSQWRQGALQGATPDDAFFVICDRSNNPVDRPDVLRIDVGVAPLRPAEFVVMSIEHRLQPGDGPGGGGGAGATSEVSSIVLEIEGARIDGFVEVGGLGHDTDVVEHRDGGDASVEVAAKTPGRHLPSDIVLTRALGSHPYLEAWLADVRDDSTATYRRNGDVVLLDGSGVELDRWRFVDGWPRAWNVSPIGLGPADAVRERIVIANEGISRVSSDSS